MQLQLEDLCEEDAATIRRAAADRLARELAAGDDQEGYDTIQTRPPMSSLFVVARSNR